MKKSEAADLVARLRGAFPGARFDEANALVYTEELAALQNPAALQDAIQSLIRTEDRLPSIAAIREEYRRHVDRHKPRELPEPDVTDVERARNAKRVRELAERIGQPLPEVES